MSPHFFISQYFLFPLGLKKEKKFAIKGVFLVCNNFLRLQPKAL
jgi:hypothetical protein